MAVVGRGGLRGLRYDQVDSHPHVGRRAQHRGVCGVRGEHCGPHPESYRERSDASDAFGHATTMRVAVSTKVKRS
jgi:hypothetical protein